MKVKTFLMSGHLSAKFKKTLIYYLMNEKHMYRKFCKELSNGVLNFVLGYVIDELSPSL